MSTDLQQNIESEGIGSTIQRAHTAPELMNAIYSMRAGETVILECVEGVHPLLPSECAEMLKRLGYEVSYDKAAARKGKKEVRFTLISTPNEGEIHKRMGSFSRMFQRLIDDIRN